jgi:thiamine biosynthesis lipoprotein
LTEAPPLISRAEQAMGTIFSITAVGKSEPKYEAALAAAFEEIARLENVLSEWLPDSEISRINAAAGSHPVPVSAGTIAVVSAGLRVSQWSQGAFDLSWAALRGVYDFRPGEEHAPDLQEIARRLPLINYRDIALDPIARTVMLRHAGMKIGVGGIAKGYALDRAAEILLRAGLSNFIIFGGGQVLVRGMRGPRPWRVGIAHPRQSDYFAYIEATRGSISTSGDYEHAFIAGGKRWHHIIDPRTGLPVEHTVSVTAVADSGIYADALSTAAFVMGPERALQRLPTAPVPTELLIIDKDLKLHKSPGLQSSLILRMPLEMSGSKGSLRE